MESTKLPINPKSKCETCLYLLSCYSNWFQYIFVFKSVCAMLISKRFVKIYSQILDSSEVFIAPDMSHLSYLVRLKWMVFLIFLICLTLYRLLAQVYARSSKAGGKCAIKISIDCKIKILGKNKVQFNPNKGFLVFS